MLTGCALGLCSNFCCGFPHQWQDCDRLALGSCARRFPLPQVSSRALAVVQAACEADLQAMEAQMAAAPSKSAAGLAGPGGQQQAASAVAPAAAAALRRASTGDCCAVGEDSAAVSYAVQAARRSEKRRIACKFRSQQHCGAVQLCSSPPWVPHSTGKDGTANL